MPIVRIADKLIYFAHVPRCAGTAVEHYLKARFGALAFSDPAYLSGAPKRRWSRSSPQHIPAWELERLFPPGFFDASFAVVRDPAERIRSVFLRQRDIEGTLPPDTDFHAWLGNLPHGWYELDNHTRPMRDFVPDGARIFRLEDGLAPLVDWLDTLAGNRNGPRSIPVINSHELRGSHHSAAHPDLAAPALDAAARALVSNRYREDFDWFGYDQATRRLDETTDMPPEIPSDTSAETQPDTPRETPKRTVILHYHLFKNAGTSLDQILKRNFGTRWVTREFPTGQGNNTTEVEAWIRDTPEAAVFSTHTAMGPLPQIEGVRIVSVMLLRDPIARIRSAYRFEHRQEAETWGAQLAKEHDFEGYVRARLAQPRDRQCRNFQTHRLASLVPGEASELERALEAARRLTVVGNVADFGGAVERLAAEIAELHPDFIWETTRANVSKNSASGEAANPEFEALLEEANADDLALLEALWDARGASNGD